MRVRAVLLAALAAGCVSDPEAPRTLAFSGTGCTEVGLALEGDLAAAQALLPAGLRAIAAREARLDRPAGRSLLLLALNHCTFRAVSAASREPEAFVWVLVEAPAELRLANATQHVFEAAHWRPRGPMLQLQQEVLPGVEPATIRGLEAGFVAGEPFAVEVEPERGGRLEVSGVAAVPGQRHVYDAAPCCRAFARGSQGVMVVDFSTGEQRFGESQCALRSTIPHLSALLGAGHAGGACAHNASYNFTATARPAG